MGDWQVMGRGWEGQRNDSEIGEVKGRRREGKGRLGRQGEGREWQDREIGQGLGRVGQREGKDSRKGGREGGQMQ